MSNINYKNMADTYNIYWLMHKLSSIFDSHTNKIYSAFHTLKDFYMICQNSGKTVVNYFDRFKVARFNAELYKGNLTKH